MNKCIILPLPVCWRDGCGRWTCTFDNNFETRKGVTVITVELQSLLSIEMNVRRCAVATVFPSADSHIIIAIALNIHFSEFEDVRPLDV